MNETDKKDLCHKEQKSVRTKKKKQTTEKSCLGRCTKNESRTSMWFCSDKEFHSVISFLPIKHPSFHCQ